MNINKSPWRGAFFALIVMALLFFNIYTHNKMVHKSEKPLWFIIPIAGLFMFIVGNLRDFLKTYPAMNSRIGNYRIFLAGIVGILLILYWLWQLRD
jgi:CDP-diglyceride synthetase